MSTAEQDQIAKALVNSIDRTLDHPLMRNPLKAGRVVDLSEKALWAEHITIVNNLKLNGKPVGGYFSPSTGYIYLDEETLLYSLKETKDLSSIVIHEFIHADQAERMFYESGPGKSAFSEGLTELKTRIIQYDLIGRYNIGGYDEEVKVVDALKNLIMKKTGYSRNEAILMLEEVDVLKSNASSKIGEIITGGDSENASAFLPKIYELFQKKDYKELYKYIEQYE